MVADLWRTRAGRAPADPHDGRFEQDAPLDLRGLEQLADEGLGVFGLGETPGDELFRRDRRRADVDPDGIGRDLEGEALGSESAPVDQRNRECAQAGVEHALVAQPREEEGLLQGGRQGRPRGFLDDEDPLARGADARRCDQGGETAAEDERVPTPRARRFARIQGGKLDHVSTPWMGSFSQVGMTAPAVVPTDQEPSPDKNPGSKSIGGSPAALRSITPIL